MSNFFNNLKEPVNFINNILQLKPKEALVDLARFGLNSTIGLLGLFDPASRLKLERNSEDFGQTLGKWGVPAGPYLELPFIGGRNLRDTVGFVPNYLSNGRQLFIEDKVFKR